MFVVGILHHMWVIKRVFILYCFDSNMIRKVGEINFWSVTRGERHLLTRTKWVRHRCRRITLVSIGFSVWGQLILIFLVFVRWDVALRNKGTST